MNEQEPNIDNYVLSDEQIQEMVRRKEDYLAGKTKARPWGRLRGSAKQMVL